MVLSRDALTSDGTVVSAGKVIEHIMNMTRGFWLKTARALNNVHRFLYSA